MIEKGNLVSVHYTGKLNDGQVFDSSLEREPLKFQVGSGQIIPGFENAILGKNVGDKISTNISVDQAYGEIREDLLVKVEKDKLPGEVEIGQSLSAKASNGQDVNVTVKEINEDYIVVDGNHPLSGQELFFDIEVLEIEKI